MRLQGLGSRERLVLPRCGISDVGCGWLVDVQTRAPAPPVHRNVLQQAIQDFWAKFSRERLTNIPAEQLAGVSRITLRAHDACPAGDEVDSNALFHRPQTIRF